MLKLGNAESGEAIGAVFGGSGHCEIFVPVKVMKEIGNVQ
jgi:hypothetical protein